MDAYVGAIKALAADHSQTPVQLLLRVCWKDSFVLRCAVTLLIGRANRARSRGRQPNHGGSAGTERGESEGRMSKEGCRTAPRQGKAPADSSAA